jgi:NTP pyrophosphatase (non-canonical NTP hydrolase)
MEEEYGVTDLCRRALNLWGPQAQCMMLFEEMAELTQAINHLLRVNCEENETDLIGEIADVEIMLEQIKYMFNIDENDINDFKKYKWIRLLNRIRRDEDYAYHEKLANKEVER